MFEPHYKHFETFLISSLKMIEILAEIFLFFLEILMDVLIDTFGGGSKYNKKIPL